MAPVDCVSSPARFLSVRTTAFTLVENLHFAPIYIVSSILLRTLPKWLIQKPMLLQNLFLLAIEGEKLK